MSHSGTISGFSMYDLAHTVPVHARPVRFGDVVVLLGVLTSMYELRPSVVNMTRARVDGQITLSRWGVWGGSLALDPCS